MYFIMKASFDRSLLRYVDTVEGERLERLADSLEGAYRQHGSWDFLRDDPATWLQLVAASRPDRRMPPH
ncbi:MAG: two-component sensor histidine kinase, partial [Desulfobacteraceae bacterium]